MKFCIYLISIVFIVATFNGCSTSKQTVDSFNYITNLYELYIRANKLDSSTIKYIKNEYLIDLLVNASKNEQLGLYHQAIVDLLDAYRFDSSKIILYALARNFYWIEKLTLAFDYAFKSYLLDTNFIPTIELLTNILSARGQFSEAYFFSNKILQLKGNKASIDNLKQHIIILDEIDSSLQSTISFLKSIDNSEFEWFVNSELLYRYYQRKDTANQNLILERMFSSSNNLKDLPNIYFELYFTNLLDRNEYEKALIKFQELLGKISNTHASNIIEIFVSKIKSINLTNKKLVEDFCEFTNIYFPNNPRIQYQILKIYSILNDTTNMYLQCKKILSNENVDFETLVNTSYVLYYDLNKKTEAIQGYNSFKYKFFDIPTYYNVLGEFYANSQQYSLAEEVLLKSYNLDSTDYRIYNILGWFYFEIEDWNKSDYYYSKSLEIFPNNPITLNNLAYSLIVRDTNLSYAKTLIEKAVSLEPDNPNFLDTYGWYFYKIGNYEKAKYYIEKSIELDSTRPEPFLHLSLIYKKLGDNSNANYFLEKAISIDPNNKEIIKELEKEQNKR